MTPKIRLLRDELLKLARDYADMTDGPESWPVRHAESVLTCQAKLRLACKEWRRAEREEIARRNTLKGSVGKAPTLRDVGNIPTPLKGDVLGEH